MIDHKNLHRRSIRFQSQPELLLNIGEDRRQRPIRNSGFHCLGSSLAIDSILSSRKVKSQEP